jgi:hypothetical protein
MSANYRQAAFGVRRSERSRMVGDQWFALDAGMLRPVISWTSRCAP